MTTRVVGVDTNPAYLEETRRRFRSMAGLALHRVDLASEQIDIEPVDLVHAALIFEHAGIARCLDNALALVAPAGHLSVIVQLPSDADGHIGSTPFESIRRLGSDFSLVDPDELTRGLATRGYFLERQRTHGVASGKALWAGVFCSGSHTSCPRGLEVQG